jgi:hypothetical protein
MWTRQELLAERKIQIGSLAANFIEAPEERIINLGSGHCITAFFLLLVLLIRIRKDLEDFAGSYALVCIGIFRSPVD